MEKARDVLEKSEAQLKDEVEVFTSQLEQLRNERNSLSVKLREQDVIEEDLNSKVGLISTLKADKEKLKLHIDENKKEIEKIEIQLQRADKRVEQLETELRENKEEVNEALARAEDSRKVIQELRREKDELVGMIGQRSSDANSKFTQKMDKLREENRDLQKKLEETRHEARQSARYSMDESVNKTHLRDKQRLQDIVEDLKVENQRLKNKMSEKSRGDESLLDKQLERENRELRQELRQLHQESRQHRQRSFSRNRYFSI